MAAEAEGVAEGAAPLLEAAGAEPVGLGAAEVPAAGAELEAAGGATIFLKKRVSNSIDIPFL